MAHEEMGLEAVLRRLIREEIQAALDHLNGRDRFLTAEQAAELLACSPDFLYRRVNRLPFVRRIENMVRFSERGIWNMGGGPWCTIQLRGF